jgi:hypothetical protein
MRRSFRRGESCFFPMVKCYNLFSSPYGYQTLFVGAYAIGMVEIAIEIKGYSNYPPNAADIVLGCVRPSVRPSR